MIHYSALLGNTIQIFRNPHEAAVEYLIKLLDKTICFYIPDSPGTGTPMANVMAGN